MRTILFLIVVPLLLAAQVGAADDSKKAKGTLKLPADAEKIDSFTHRHTDANGKTWIYRTTPFGLVRYEDEDSKAAGKTSKPKSSSASSSLIQAFDEGDSVRFEKLSPFGKHRWVRKKTELNDEERAAYERALNKKKKSGASTPGADAR
ncbi:MAG: hypothetical protein GY953_55940 [bacterium]|nr:hypothetical protein [bacterium]